jgi:hypothetical protein
MSQSTEYRHFAHRNRGPVRSDERTDRIAAFDSSDGAANQLPDVVVDDVAAGNKVNLRNVAPADTPILLWMYAPH